MKQIAIRIGCIVAAFLVAGSANAYIEEIEKGYEVNELLVVMTASDTGTAIVRECDTCEDVTLEITPETRLYKSNREVPLAQVLRYRGQPGVVFREMKSKHVTRIKIY